MPVAILAQAKPQQVAILVNPVVSLRISDPLVLVPWGGARDGVEIQMVGAAIHVAQKEIGGTNSPAGPVG